MQASELEGKYGGQLEKGYAKVFAKYTIPACKSETEINAEWKLAGGQNEQYVKKKKSQAVLWINRCLCSLAAAQEMFWRRQFPIRSRCCVKSHSVLSRRDEQREKTNDP